MLMVLHVFTNRRSRKLSVKNYSTVQYMNGSSMDGESIVKGTLYDHVYAHAVIDNFLVYQESCQ